MFHCQEMTNLFKTHCIILWRRAAAQSQSTFLTPTALELQLNFTINLAMVQLYFNWEFALT